MIVLSNQIETSAIARVKYHRLVITAFNSDNQHTSPGHGGYLMLITAFWSFGVLGLGEG